MTSPEAPKPSPAEFRTLARGHTVVPVWREVLADLETPVSAFVKLVGSAPSDPAGFLLESVEHAERWGRFTFLGSDPALTMVVRGRSVEFDGAVPPAFASLWLESLPWLVAIRAALFVPFRLYEGLWRYTGISDLWAIVFGVFCSSAMIPSAQPIALR